MHPYLQDYWRIKPDSGSPAKKQTVMRHFPALIDSRIPLDILSGQDELAFQLSLLAHLFLQSGTQILAAQVVHLHSICDAIQTKNLYKHMKGII